MRYMHAFAAVLFFFPVVAFGASINVNGIPFNSSTFTKCSDGICVNSGGITDSMLGLTAPTLGVASATSLAISGTAGAGYIDLPSNSTPTDPGTDHIRLFKSGGSAALNIEIPGGNITSLNFGSISPNRTYIFPNIGGTLITTSDTGTVTDTMLAGSIAASKLIGTDIATVGTLTAGAINWSNDITTSGNVAGAIVKTTCVAIASLPTAGTAGRRTCVNDQLTACPALSGTFTNGGSVVCSAFDNGTAWVHE